MDGDSVPPVRGLSVPVSLGGPAGDGQSVFSVPHLPEPRGWRGVALRLRRAWARLMMWRHLEKVR